MSRLLRFVVVLGALLVFSPWAQAAVLYSGGMPDSVSGNDMNVFLQAEDFLLPAAASIDQIRFWAVQTKASDYAGSIYWAIYSSSGSRPGTLLSSGLTAATQTDLATAGPAGYGQFQYDLGVSVTLGPGTYWLALHNGQLSTMRDELAFLWATAPSNLTARGVEALLLGGAAGTFGTNSSEHAFTLSGTDNPEPNVPEPATVFVTVPALTTLLLLRKRG